MVTLRGNVSLEFLVAIRTTDRSAIVGHDLGIGMHRRERLAMAVVPSVKSKARRFDHAHALACSGHISFSGAS